MTLETNDQLGDGEGRRVLPGRLVNLCNFSNSKLRRPATSAWGGKNTWRNALSALSRIHEHKDNQDCITSLVIDGAEIVMASIPPSISESTAMFAYGRGITVTGIQTEETPSGAISKLELGIV